MGTLHILSSDILRTISFLFMFCFGQFSNLPKVDRSLPNYRYQIRFRHKMWLLLGNKARKTHPNTFFISNFTYPSELLKTHVLEAKSFQAEPKDFWDPTTKSTNVSCVKYQRKKIARNMPKHKTSTQAPRMNCKIWSRGSERLQSKMYSMVLFERKF